MAGYKNPWRYSWHKACIARMEEYNASPTVQVDGEEQVLQFFRERQRWSHKQGVARKGMKRLRQQIRKPNQ
jgi:hypothetical protein